MNALLENWKLIGGAILAVVAILMVIKGIYDRATAIRIAGEIVEFSRNPQGYYFPIVTFMYKGQILNMPLANGSSTPKGNVGDQVIVLYNPKNIKNVNIAGNYTDIIMGILVGAYGILTVITELG